MNNQNKPHWLQKAAWIATALGALAIPFLIWNLIVLQCQLTLQQEEFDSTLVALQRQGESDSMVLLEMQEQTKIQGAEFDSSMVAFQEQQTLNRAFFQEMRRQTELRNKGFLAIRIDSAKVVGYDCLEYWFSYFQQSRTPVIIYFPRYHLLTFDREISVGSWTFLIESSVKTDSSRLSPGFIDSVVTRKPIIYNRSIQDTFCLTAGLFVNDSSLPQNAYGGTRLRIVTKRYGFFLHLIFKYEDLLGKNYWVYERWKFLPMSSYDDTVHKKNKAIDLDFVPEEHLVWEAGPDDRYPKWIPKELQELQNRAFEKQIDSRSIHFGTNWLNPP